jgi:hypothetical protein
MNKGDVYRKWIDDRKSSSISFCMLLGQSNYNNFSNYATKLSILFSLLRAIALLQGCNTGTLINKNSTQERQSEWGKIKYRRINYQTKLVLFIKGNEKIENIEIYKRGNKA